MNGLSAAIYASLAFVGFLVDAGAYSLFHNRDVGEFGWLGAILSEVLLSRWCFSR